jgi:alpha-amylase
LGEFNQKGTIPTRWGTKDQLISAVSTAKAHGIDVLIDAILNVRIEIWNYFYSLTCVLQHKLGADRLETINAVPVDPQNRLKTIGPVREIEVGIVPNSYCI